MKALTILKACRERGQKRAGGLDLDEAIAELEEAMKPKTCDYYKFDKGGASINYPPKTIFAFGYYYELKDNA